MFCNGMVEVSSLFIKCSPNFITSFTVYGCAFVEILQVDCNKGNPANPKSYIP